MSKYFVYDSYDTGFEEFETLEGAEKHFEEITDFSTYSDGWPQEILDGAIKLGIITHVSCDGEHRHTDHKEWDFECDIVQAEVLDNPMSLLQQELQKAQEEINSLRSAYKKNIDSLSAGLSEDLLKILKTYPTALPYICELKQELQKTREQLEKALIHLKIVLVDDTTSDQFCDAEEFLSSFKDKQGE